jgi:hypothetical protein
VRTQERVITSSLPDHILGLADPRRAGTGLADQGAGDDFVTGGDRPQAGVHDRVGLIVLADEPDRSLDPDEVSDLSDELVGTGVRLVGDRIQRHERS